MPAAPKLKAPEKGQRVLSGSNNNPLNPRKISDVELTALSLGGIILNRITGQLVGGHQRVAAFRQGEVAATITDELKKPDRTGTVAFGHIELNGTRYGYREVVWTTEQEKIANIAANNIGGDWDNALLAEVLKSIKDLAPSGDGTVTALEQTGFNDSDLTKLLADLEKSPGGGGGRKPTASDDDYSLFELIMQHENKKRWTALLDRIRTNESLKTLEEAIMWLVDEHEGKKPNEQSKKDDHKKR
jgi:hypothetical protein